ncbi:hypothetical protein AYI69_g4594 [Smittium culicis]|uniref:Uncharacterized protein n=1 Tax=Smittium culicis TaxID=133412 RepID=A0A1R1YCD7_9FUNG|nr:hypothetical protein AYI69_g4594 [Smittium culicis]
MNKLVFYTFLVSSLKSITASPIQKDEVNILDEYKDSQNADMLVAGNNIKDITHLARRKGDIYENNNQDISLEDHGITFNKENGYIVNQLPPPKINIIKNRAINNLKNSIGIAQATMPKTKTPIDNNQDDKEYGAIESELNGYYYNGKSKEYVTIFKTEYDQELESSNTELFETLFFTKTVEESYPTQPVVARQNLSIPSLLPQNSENAKGKRNIQIPAGTNNSPANAKNETDSEYEAFMVVDINAPAPSVQKSTPKARHFDRELFQR